MASRSIGIDVNNGGAIDDVLFGSPAYNAGLGPLMKIIAVDGEACSADALNDAIAHPTNSKITLPVQNFGTVESHEISYPGGLRYPHPERSWGEPTDDCRLVEHLYRRPLESLVDYSGDLLSEVVGGA